MQLEPRPASAAAARRTVRGFATRNRLGYDVADAVPVARAYVALLDEMDGYCREGLLLTVPPDPRVTELRHWFVEQAAAQLLYGRAAVPPAG